MNPKIQYISEQAFVISATLVALSFGIDSVARWRRVQQVAFSVLVLSGTVIGYDLLDHKLLSSRKWTPYEVAGAQWADKFKYNGDLTSFRAKSNKQFSKDIGTRQQLHTTGRADLGEDEELIQRYAQQALASAAGLYFKDKFPKLTVVIRAPADFYVDFKGNRAVVAYEATLQVLEPRDDFDEPQLCHETGYRSEITLNLQTKQPESLEWMVESIGDFG